MQDASGGDGAVAPRAQWPPRISEAQPHSRLWTGLGQSLSQAVEQRRLFVLLPFGLIAGLICYALPLEEPQSVLLALPAVLAIATILIALRVQSLVWLRFGVQLAAFAVGFALLPMHGALFGTSMLSRAVYGTYEARVDEIISADTREQRFVVSGLTPVGESRAVDIRRARLLLRDAPQFQPGDIIRATLRLAPVPGPVLPGAHDGQFHAYFSGIGAYGSATGPVELAASGDESDFSRRVQALRNYISGRIGLVLEGPSAAIGKAMVVGDQSGITDDIRQVMAESGLAHIYSISGLHLSIVAGGIFWLVRLALASVPAFVGWPVKRLSAVIGLIAAFGYLLLAGGADNVPAFRSTLMLALIFGAVLAGRRALTMRNVAIAAVVIVLLDPASVFRPSFQLSFAAVVGLIGIYELPRPLKRPRGGWLAATLAIVSGTAWTSFIAGAATLLFSAYHFQQTAPLSVLGNVLALPFVSLVIMPFGVLGVLAMPLGLDAPFIAIMGWGIDRMVDVAMLVAGWSQGWTGNPLLSGWTLVAGLAALSWFAFVDTRWRLLGPALCIPVVVLFGFEGRPDILVSDTTQAVAIRTEDGMALASGRAGSFAVDVWGQHYQLEIAATHPDTRCDGQACVVNGLGYSVAIIRDPGAFAEDCAGHDLVIARIRPPVFCTPGMLLGPQELAAGGVHWLRWDEKAGRFDLRPAIPSLSRMWRVVPR